MSIFASRRLTDQNDYLTKTQKKALQTAKQFIANKQYKQAAATFKQAEMMREAIDVLEHHGYISQAAEVLVSMNNYPRAGYLLARNRHFMEASEIFQKAGMIIEAATAAKEGEHYDVASELFMDAKQPLAAAECYIKVRDFLKAARCFASSDVLDNAAKCYRLFLKHNPNSAEMIQETDHFHIFRCLLNGEKSPALAKAIRGTRFFPLLIKQLAGHQKQEIIIMLLKLASEEDLNGLIASLNYTEPYILHLAVWLGHARQMKFAGYIWERTQHYDRAAMAFEQGGVYRRAITLYQQLGNIEAIKRIQATIDSPQKNITSNRIIRSSSKNIPRHSSQTPQKPAIKKAQKPQPQKKPKPKKKKAISDITIKSCSSLTPPKPYYLAHIFVDLTRLECNQVWEYGTIREISKNAQLYSKAQPIEFMSIVLKGQLTDHKNHFEESDCIGELTMFSEVKQHLEIFAAIPTDVFCLTHEEYLSFAYDHPNLAFKISTAFLNHLVETHNISA